MSSSEAEIGEQFKDDQRYVIVEAANEIATEARSNASQISEKLSNAISVGELVDWASGLGIYIKVDLSIAPFAKATEYGYPETVIYGRNGPMHFIGTHEWAGKWVVSQEVTHPEMPAKPYLRPAIDAHRADINELLKMAGANTISRAIRTAWLQGGGK